MFFFYYDRHLFPVTRLYLNSTFPIVDLLGEKKKNEDWRKFHFFPQGFVYIPERPLSHQVTNSNLNTKKHEQLLCNYYVFKTPCGLVSLLKAVHSKQSNKMKAKQKKKPKKNPKNAACFFFYSFCMMTSFLYLNGMDLPYMNFWTQNLFVCLLLFLPVDFHHRLKCIFSLPVNFLSTKLKYEVKKCIQECIVVGEYWLFVTIIHNRYYFISKQNGIIIINSVFFYFFIIIHPIMIIYY